jgi:hypothetical protein
MNNECVAGRRRGRGVESERVCATFFGRKGANPRFLYVVVIFFTDSNTIIVCMTLICTSIIIPGMSYQSSCRTGKPDFSREVLSVCPIMASSSLYKLHPLFNLYS